MSSSSTLSPAVHDWLAAGSQFLHNDHSIFFRDSGVGRPLLCIHGFPTASWDWHRVWPSLTKNHRLIAADMIGYGSSAKPRNYDYSIFDQADLHEELLESLGVTGVDVLAHDYGDTVLQELLARQLQGKQRFRIRSACLLNGGLFPERHRLRPIQSLLLSPLGPIVARLLNQRRFNRSFSAVFGRNTQPSAVELKDFWSVVQYNDGPLVAPRLIRYIRERKQHRERWVGALEKTDVPLLLICGPEDPVSGRHMAARYEELIPDPQVLMLEDIGHYPQIEAPEAVVEAVQSHLRTTESNRI